MMLAEARSKLSRIGPIQLNMAKITRAEEKANAPFEESFSTFSEHSPLTWDAVDLGNCPKHESLQKWLGEGAEGLF